MQRACRTQAPCARASRSPLQGRCKARRLAAGPPTHHADDLVAVCALPLARQEECPGGRDSSKGPADQTMRRELRATAAKPRKRSQAVGRGLRAAVVHRQRPAEPAPERHAAAWAGAPTLNTATQLPGPARFHSRTVSSLLAVRTSPARVGWAATSCMSPPWPRSDWRAAAGGCEAGQGGVGGGDGHWVGGGVLRCSASGGLALSLRAPHPRLPSSRVPPPAPRPASGPHHEERLAGGVQHMERRRGAAKQQQRRAARGVRAPLDHKQLLFGLGQGRRGGSGAGGAAERQGWQAGEGRGWRARTDAGQLRCGWPLACPGAAPSHLPRCRPAAPRHDHPRGTHIWWPAWGVTACGGCTFLALCAGRQSWRNRGGARLPKTTLELLTWFAPTVASKRWCAASRVLNLRPKIGREWCSRTLRVGTAAR